MARLERRLFVRSVAIGVVVTAGVLLVNAMGWLDTLEGFLWDQRFIYCQIRQAKPTDKIIHLDIDDASIDAVGRWPWPREEFVKVIDEIQRAKPKAVALDILLSELEKPRLELNSQGKLITIDDNVKLAESLNRGNLVLSADFHLQDDLEKQSPTLMRCEEWFRQDLELSRDEFGKKLAEAQISKLSETDIDDLYLRSRRYMMKVRLDQELANGLIPKSQVLKRLLPNTDPNIDSPLTHLLSEQYSLSSAAFAILRFGTPSQTLPLPAVQGTFGALPCPIFSDVAAGCGFVNYDIFGTPVVRSVPLYIEFDHRLYPQMGLSFACVLMNANPTTARFEGSNIVIPAPDGPVYIPTHLFNSRKLGRKVSLIAAVPWFGTREWKFIYDWPNHQIPAAHISLARIWDICASQERIIKNNASIDRAVSQILNDDREDKLRLDPAVAKKYAAALPDEMDISARETIAAKTLQELKDSGWLEQFRGIPDAELKSNERFQRDQLYDANNALNQLIPQNRKLVVQIQNGRKWLADQIGNNGVLVGFTATGLWDKVSTSLYPNCPGVVVHGVIANAVMERRWWRAAPDWITSLLIVILGLVTALALGRFSPLRASGVTALLLVGYALVNGYALFGWQKVIVNAAGPIVAIAAVWAAITLYRLILETLERIRIATEVAIISREMELARQVQVALIPAKPPKKEGLETEGWALPASVTGGDCYDLWEMADGRIAVLVADASGHGLAPAMIVSQVRTLMRALCDLETHPHGLLARVNARVASDLEANRFITAFLGFITADGKLDWASAGHGPMYWFSASGEEILELDSTGMPLGIQEDWLADEPSPALQLNGSGMLVVFSDGINEARSPSGEMYGVERVKEIIKNCSSKTSAEVIAAIRKSVQDFQQKTEPIDDQTVVVVRRISKPVVA